ncbi:hypothetical protein BV25DRAFT_1863229 [Artomyces pyxidatus]|uniref:Uncharacterized protein n=1 Tax=Artomyces pyxidatus TaxID=48021 RepID=A0ACB8SPJ3_9AGAM|nr:hypothetical protein BV25DRAFT_1863229 [Artomyces pyxidatus]
MLRLRFLARSKSSNAPTTADIGYALSQPTLTPSYIDPSATRSILTSRYLEMYSSIEIS